MCLSHHRDTSIEAAAGKDFMPTIIHHLYVETQVYLCLHLILAVILEMSIGHVPLGTGIIIPHDSGL